MLQSRTHRITAVLTLLLCGLMILLCACHTDAGSETPTQAETAGTTITEAPTEEPTEQPTEATTEAPTEAPTEEPTEAPTEPETEPPIVDVMIGETLDAPYASNFTVSKVFTNDMVVQRNEHIRVWGWADEAENGKKISGEFLGMFAETLVENGEWTLTFGARQPANTELGNHIRIYTDKKEVLIRDVLVGDVYFVIGQSNVAYSMLMHYSYVSDPARGGSAKVDATAPIRLHYNSLNQTIPGMTRGTEDVCKDIANGATWQKPSSSSINNFSALGYLFAKNLVKDLDGKVPVGIIEIDGNGQPIGAFMPNQAAESVKSDTWNQAKGYYTTAGCNGDAARYMYNHYMFPFEKFAIAGVLWYQGESDLGDSSAASLARAFPAKFNALMTHMRSTHNLCYPNFPVIVMEFPSEYRESNVSVIPNGQFWAYMDFGFMRTMLGKTVYGLSNSYLSVSSDVWNDRTFWNTLHPNCKWEQSVRAARIAAALSDEFCTVDEAVGPVLESVVVSEDKKSAILTYKNVGEGLKTIDGATEVLGFQAVRVDKKDNYLIEKLASVTITAPNQITVTAKRAIDGIVYNADTELYFGETLNLCNSYGTPAGATCVMAED